jgi:cytochrome P450
MADPRATWQQLAEAGTPVWFEHESCWLVHRPGDVRNAARTPDVFANQVSGSRNLRHDFLLTTDGERHRHDRRAFIRRFAGRLAAAESAATAVVGPRLARLPASGGVEMFSEFCVPIAAEVADMVIGRLDEELLLGAAPEVAATLAGMISDRARSSTDESPVALLAGDLREAGCDRETADTRAGVLACSILMALQETLASAVALTCLAIGHGERIDPQQPLKARSPLLGLFREAMQDTQLGGAQIRRGQIVMLAFDAASFASTEDFSFGVGEHRCPAASLANAVVNASVAAVSSVGRLRIAEPPRFGPHSHFRIPDRLECLFDV